MYPAAPQRLPVALLLIALCASGASVSAQDPAAERLYSQAQRLLQSGNGANALEELELLAQQFPEDRLASKALLQVAGIRRAQGDLEAARLAIERLRADYGRSLESAAAFVMQAEIEVEEARRREHLEEARATYRRVPLLFGRENYPELEDRAEARVRSGELSLELGDHEDAVAEFLAAVEDEPPSRFTGLARLKLATAMIRGGEWTAAAEVLQVLASEGPASDGLQATSTAADRAAAVRLLSLIHRLVVRPLSGLEPWQTTSRYPASGLQLREPSGVAAAEDGRLVIVDSRLPLTALVAADGQVEKRVEVRDAVRPGWSARTAYVVTELGIVAPFDDQRSPRFLEPRPGKESYLKGLVAAVRGRFDDWFVIAKAWKSLLSYESPRQGQALLASSKPDLVDLARDHLGRVYALDRRDRQVVRLGVDRRQTEVVLKGAGWKRPVALDLDPFGNVYVLDRGLGSVEVFDPAGRRLARVGPQLGGGVELRNPVDVAVDGSGRLFIADAKLPFVVMLD